MILSNFDADFFRLNIVLNEIKKKIFTEVFTFLIKLTKKHAICFENIFSDKTSAFFYEHVFVESDILSRTNRN